MEIAVVAEAEQVEFQALALHHAFSGQVTDADFREVGLPRYGTETRKLGTVEPHPIIVFGMPVLESLQHLGRIVVPILSLASQRLQIIFLPVHFPYFYVQDTFPALRAATCRRDNARSRRPARRCSTDAVALIVNPKNNCEKLTVSEISDILSGRTTSWNEIQPSDRGKIRVILDQTGSSLATYLTDSLLHGEPLGPTVFGAGSIPKVFEIVEIGRAHV